MPEEILNPLLALIKEQSLIDDLQFEEVVAEHKRSGNSVVQILQDFGIMDLDTILQLIANHMGTQVISLRDTNFSPDLLNAIPAKTARMYRCVPVHIDGRRLCGRAMMVPGGDDDAAIHRYRRGARAAR